MIRTFLALIILLTFASPAPAGQLSGQVRQVVDGDTLVVRVAGADVRVRIADIDAPEMHGRCPAESALATRAKLRLTGLVDGRWVILTVDDHRGKDRHGRMLATVALGGVAVGEALIAEGLVRRWDGKRRSWC